MDASSPAMRTAGILLLFAAVALRGFVVFSGRPEFAAVMGWLAAYGILLLLRTWAEHRRRLGALPRPLALAYLLLQFAIVLRLLAASTYVDFFGGLVVPLSLDAVLFFGARAGFTCIAAFSLGIAAAFQSSHEGRVFGLAMAALNAGMYCLIGGYAHQVQKAEAAQRQNRRTFEELEAAHRTLQVYADQAAALAVEQERNTLARELHDSVTQTVFSMNLAAQSARLLLDRGSAAGGVAAQLQRIDELAGNALAEIGSLAAHLRPRPVGEEGLPAALRRLAAERGQRDGLEIRLAVNCERAASEAEAAGLYAIAQEALANVARHSGVREAAVRLDLNARAFHAETRILYHASGLTRPAMAANSPPPPPSGRRPDLRFDPADRLFRDPAAAADRSQVPDHHAARVRRHAGAVRIRRAAPMRCGCCSG